MSWAPSLSPTWTSSWPSAMSSPSTALSQTRPGAASLALSGHRDPITATACSQTKPCAALLALFGLLWWDWVAPQTYSASHPDTNLSGVSPTFIWGKRSVLLPGLSLFCQMGVGVPPESDTHRCWVCHIPTDLSCYHLAGAHRTPDLLCVPLTILPVRRVVTYTHLARHDQVCFVRPSFSCQVGIGTVRLKGFFF